MNNDNVIYDSNEISSIVSKINDSTSIIDSNIKSSLYNDFSVLEELDFFSDGLGSLRNQVNMLENINDKLVYLLNEHDSNLNELNNKHLALFNESIQVENKEIVDEGINEIDNIDLNKISDGEIILSEYINSIVPNLSYEGKTELLKKILNDGENSLTMLTDESQSDTFVHQIKEHLKDKYSMELSKLPKDKEKELQREFFDAISDNDTNIFEEIKENSLLHGLGFFKKTCKNNDISVSDLLFDEKNNSLFMKTLNELYNAEEMDILTPEAFISFKNYINGIAEKNNLSTINLLQEEKYSSVLKGGIFYEN